jgi:hypothetical protein
MSESLWRYAIRPRLCGYGQLFASSEEGFLDIVAMKTKDQYELVLTPDEEHEHNRFTLDLFDSQGELAGSYQIEKVPFGLRKVSDV